MQMTLFEYIPSPREIYEENVQLKKNIDKIRRGTYSEISRLKGEISELKTRFEHMERGVCRK